MGYIIHDVMLPRLGTNHFLQYFHTRFYFLFPARLFFFLFFQIEDKKLVATPTSDIWLIYETIVFEMVHTFMKGPFIGWVTQLDVTFVGCTGPRDGTLKGEE